MMNYQESKKMLLDVMKGKGNFEFYKYKHEAEIITPKLKIDIKYPGNVIRIRKTH